MKGRSLKYSGAEIAWLEANKTLVISDYHRAFREVFGRDDVSLANLHALRKRRGWKTGRTGCFPKAHDPHNKGKAFPTAARHPNCRKTQFKKGGLPGNTKWLGHERVSKDGYVEISVDETNPHTGYGRRYVLKQVWAWEKLNGPIPAKHCLKCLDGDRANTDPANWTLIPRALLPRLNGGRHKRTLPYDQAAPEVRPVILTVAKVEHQARQLRKAGATP